jgi:hypothetical protein
MADATPTDRDAVSAVPEVLSGLANASSCGQQEAPSQCPHSQVFRQLLGALAARPDLVGRLDALVVELLGAVAASTPSAGHPSAPCDDARDARDAGWSGEGPAVQPQQRMLPQPWVVHRGGRAA